MNDEQVNHILEKLATDMGAIHGPSLGRDTFCEAMRVAFCAGFKAGYLNFDPGATGTTVETAWRAYRKARAVVVVGR